MLKDTVITISREYGSGGRLIGKKLAEQLGVDFYDNRIIEIAAEQSGLSEEFMAQTEEKASGGLLYSLSYLGNLGYSLSLNDQVFIAQCNVIREIAEKGPCVIVGRCADYILRNRQHCLHIFIHAPQEKRAQLATELYGLDNEKAVEQIAKIDKQRENYYNHYTNNKWGRVSNYHLTIDSGVTGIDGAVDAIKCFIDATEKCEAEGGKIYGELD